MVSRKRLGPQFRLLMGSVSVEERNWKYRDMMINHDLVNIGHIFVEAPLLCIYNHIYIDYGRFNGETADFKHWSS